ncbi:MAG: prephenate dehydrogenase [Oscillospiraceae bacterium]
MKIAVVGLGLIGGSIAKAMKYKTNHKIYGFDIDRGVLLKAKLLGAIDDEITPEILSDCDMVITALYPNDTIDYITKNAAVFKKGAIVMDSCGVKKVICEPLWRVAKDNGFVFLGSHPMAGLHFSGFEYSEVNMFSDASMIIVPSAGTDIEVLEKVKKLFLSLGFTNIQISTPDEHDKIIAYTSQLAHIVSNAYVKSPNAKVHSGFSAGSYNDLTRVAKLNEVMWTELFLENKENLIGELDTIIENLGKYAKALKEEDANSLEALLKDGRQRKESIDGLYKN